MNIRFTLERAKWTWLGFCLRLIINRPFSFGENNEFVATRFKIYTLLPFRWSNFWNPKPPLKCTPIIDIAITNRSKQYEDVISDQNPLLQMLNRNQNNA